MTKKTILVTGCTPGGIGLETAVQLAKLGHDVHITCRTPSLAQKAQAVAREERGVAVRAAARGLDLEQRASIEAFARDFVEPIDVLINNAGIMGVQSLDLLPDYGVERIVGVNHVGTFLLTRLLEPRLLAAAARSHSVSRVVNVSSDALFWARGEYTFEEAFRPKDFDSTRQYALSKLFNSLHATGENLRWRAQGKPLVAAAVHPGVIATNLSRHMKIEMNADTLPWTPISLEEGSRTSVLAATTQLEEAEFPVYFFRNAAKAKKFTSEQKDQQAAKQLCEFTEKWLKLEGTGSAKL